MHTRGPRAASLSSPLILAYHPARIMRWPRVRVILVGKTSLGWG